jgi:hypothetical protein
MNKFCLNFAECRSQNALGNAEMPDGARVCHL